MQKCTRVILLARIMDGKSLLLFRCLSIVFAIQFMVLSLWLELLIVLLIINESTWLSMTWWSPTWRDSAYPRTDNMFGLASHNTWRASLQSYCVTSASFTAADMTLFIVFESKHTRNRHLRSTKVTLVMPFVPKGS